MNKVKLTDTIYSIFNSVHPILSNTQGFQLQPGCRQYCNIY